MAIALRVTGTWAEITTDNATVAIPATPQAGDRMFLWVQWKDFAITLVTPSGWVLDSDFSDGAVSTGNGLGSIHTAVFHRDWQSGDANPALDFSTTTNLLVDAVITVFSKGGGESWKTPVAVTAAWPATSTTQTVSASSSILVPDNSVVMAGIGLRDDSATFTRAATTGIDVSSGITWSADYVESPATHYSTTTGNDHAGDLGHRMITTGGSGTSTVALRVTATITATETGGVVWVVQGVDTPTTVTPTTLAHTLATFAPTVTATNNVRVTPTTLALVLATFAPTIRLHKIATPTTLALTITCFAPTVSTPRLVTPTPLSQALNTFAPIVTATANVRVTPSTLVLTLTTFAPTVSAPRLTTPTTVSLPLTAFAPSVATPRLATPPTLSLSLVTFAPTVQTPRLATPSTRSLTLSTFAPTIVNPRGVIVPTRNLTLTTFVPVVTVSSAGSFIPATANLVLSTFAPTIINPKSATPTTASLTLTRFAPTVINSRLVTPSTISLNLTTFAPTVSVGGGGDIVVQPMFVALSLTLFAPTVRTRGNLIPMDIAIVAEEFPRIAEVAADSPRIAIA